MGLLSSFFGGSKRRAKPVEGWLYCSRNESGSFSVMKILKVDELGVHVRIYSNQFTLPPTTVDETTLYIAGFGRKPNESLGMGHAPLSRRSFENSNPVFFQQSTVKDDELEGYKMWVEAGGGYF